MIKIHVTDLNYVLPFEILLLYRQVLVSFHDFMLLTRSKHAQGCKFNNKKWSSL